MQDKGIGQAARLGPKYMEIEDALTHLENEASEIRIFIQELAEGPAPTREDENLKDPNPPFMNTYSSAASRISQATKNIHESVNTLKDMLL